MPSIYPSHKRIFLWRNRALYFGPSPPLNAHVYGTAALHVGVYQPFRIRFAHGPPISCRCALVPANIHHELDFSGGIHGKLFVQFHSSDFLYFRRRFPCRDQSATIFEDRETIERFRWIYEENPGKGAVAKAIDRLLGWDGQLQPVIDPRVESTMALLRTEPDRNFSQEHLAAAVNLSPSRFLHLFKAQTGVPYRRYRIWMRLMLALQQFNRSDNMTRVALESGFADATHFSHSFRNMFGVNPAFVFRDIDRFEAEP